MIRTLTLLLVALAALAPARATAAESYDNCTGFIDSLPATISTEGTWCLRKHLYTSQLSGDAITVNADYVTIDCNGFRISGLGAGTTSQASGISAHKTGVTVRRCRVQGFWIGLYLAAYGGGLVEDNSFDHSLYTGILVEGHSRQGMVWVRRNRISDTGFNSRFAVAINASKARVEDNVISGVMTSAGEFAWGIEINEGIARGNHITGVQGGVNFNAAIHGWYAALIDNTLVALPGNDSYPIRMTGGVCRGNTAQGFTRGVEDCVGSDNAVQP